MSPVAALVAAIPSPSSGDISLGPLRFTAYGLMIALGVIAAVEIGRRRARGRGIDPEDMTAIATWAVPAGLIGARLYHVITDWRRFEGRWFDVVKVWEGGLGVPGGMIAGVLVGLWVARRRGVDLPDALDVVAPALPLAQAIGRWGNWWNQEVFGRPTDLPWGLEIDVRHRPLEFRDQATFHPTFLYESLWCLGLSVGLVLLDRHRRPRPGQLFSLYVLGYGVGRLWIEALRVDEASYLGPFRVNIWTSLAMIAGGIAGWVIAGRRGSSEVIEDGVGEGGPELDGPGAEVEVGEDGAGEPDGGVDPEEGASSPEVPERSS